MNWRAILKYAALLWFALFLIGFLEGLLITPPPDPKVILWHYVVSSLISFILGTFIFAIVCIRQSYRPFLHAALVLLVESLISLIFNRALDIWLPAINYPIVLAAIGWLVFFASFISGMLIGHILRWRKKNGEPV